MHLAAHEIPQLISEYHALMRHFGKAQIRCDALVRAQAIEIERLQGEAMRLRAAVIVRDTALSWERSQRMEAVRTLMQNVALERLQWQLRDHRVPDETGEGAQQVLSVDVPVDDLADLEGSFAAADLVICQTGCLSHGAYWRVQDHCRRTGKTCVLVEQSAAAHIAGFEPPSQSESAIEWLAAPAS
ncbi:DUF2325 domain-containing protein [Acidovorax sp. CCYZU-2555]|uniref:DUF2325 domain-containing protein n=1 Tax=Acidovorax sp. CCYZU-2555 TaxID=2835042 RepID=UPI001BCFDD98|nr:DUF2325 domain-containing protein [Acidovorax sp. CCYZU-2555]MBS7778143.1 DUF2325 domain-containing protein [Acidovorax sp. CCYZU-2555]